MPSPFPGMNPFLEDPAFWPDFHATFIVNRRDTLRAVLPGGYEARIGEKVCLVEPVTLPLVILDEPREVYIEIRRRSDRSRVAVLELLSPWSKRETGYSDYLGKRQALLKHSAG